jgi:hypothetical protein
VGKVLEGQTFGTRDKLWQGIKDAFAQIAPATVQRLYKSLPDRMYAVKVAHGGPTRY